MSEYRLWERVFACRENSRFNNKKNKNKTTKYEEQEDFRLTEAEEKEEMPLDSVRLAHRAVLNKNSKCLSEIERSLEAQ